MRVAIMSDIHGNLAALEAVYEDLQARGADQIIVLGDVAFRGPRPRQCLERVQAMNPVAIIQGNTDEWLVDGLPASLQTDDESGQLLLDVYRWTREQVEPWLDVMKDWPFSHVTELGQEKAVFFHATPTSNSASVPLSLPDEKLEVHFRYDDATIFVVGHVHIPGLRRLSENRSVINVGSVGLPFDGDWRASYAILEGDGQRTAVNLIRVPYDIERALNDARESGMPGADPYEAALRRGASF